MGEFVEDREEMVDADEGSVVWGEFLEDFLEKYYEPFIDAKL